MESFCKESMLQGKMSHILYLQRREENEKNRALYLQKKSVFNTLWSAELTCIPISGYSAHIRNTSKVFYIIWK